MAHDLDPSNIERVGDGFAMQRMLDVRQLTRSVIHEIAAAVEPGMIEEDAVKLARRILASKKMLRGWHGVFVRFGRNTTKTVNAPSDLGVVLGGSDIFLVDIGPVVDRIEGDAAIRLSSALIPNTFAVPLMPALCSIVCVTNG